VGTNAVTPLFGAEIPIVAHELAEPDKGTGIAMICTSATSPTSPGGAS
jgi:valyl-tRNA synthetase